MPILPINYYKKQVSFSNHEVKRYDSLVNRYSVFRLLAILVGGFLIFKSFELEMILFTEVVFLAVIVGFAYLVRQQGRYENEKAFFSALEQVNQNELNSIDGTSNIYSDGSAFEDDKHHYTSDLDIFGKASLYHLLNRCASPLGRLKLASWLDHAASETEISERQQAIKEIGLKIDWVQNVKARLLFAKNSEIKDVENLFNYLKQENEFSGRFLNNYIRIIPFLLLISAIAAWYIPLLLILVLVFVLTNAFLVLQNQIKVNKTDRMLSMVGKTLSAYADAFKLIEDEKFDSRLCKSLAIPFNGTDSECLSTELKSLSVLVGRLEYRLNMFVGPVLNCFMAWDVRQLIGIEKWKTKNKDLMVTTFDAVASFESLLSLCSVHLNYPEYAFPEVVKHESYTYIVKNIAHPLIDSKQRVSNNFNLDNQNRIEIITGSNMAGKSTFLRTLGINAVLAFSGAPVCASKMTITVMHLFAYMRIRDSLNESISTFKAELNRLQLLLEVIEKEEKVYFLIDEMLRGTNSVDKYLGSKAVIEKLISKNAVGVVATHDLQLAELEKKYPSYMRNFYFDIQVQEGEMLFDYKLKNGECKTFNASLLLKKIGIEIDPEDH